MGRVGENIALEERVASNESGIKWLEDTFDVRGLYLDKLEARVVEIEASRTEHGKLILKLEQAVAEIRNPRG